MKCSKTLQESACIHGVQKSIARAFNETTDALSPFVAGVVCCPSIEVQEDIRGVATTLPVAPIPSATIKGEVATGQTASITLPEVATEADTIEQIKEQTPASSPQPANLLTQLASLPPIPLHDRGSKLMRNREEWVPAPDDIRTIVSRGYHWTWKHSRPPPVSYPAKTQTQKRLVPLVQDWIQQGAVVPVPLQKCFLSIIFTTPKSDGTLRLILE